MSAPWNPRQSEHVYRPDVDGLRAVAVLAVLVFHAFPQALPGGFVGVDIFFIISGFLISNILFESLDRGRFTFLDFYDRRVRRIFPALVLVCAACLVAGVVILLPAEFTQLGKHVIGGATFSSNLILLFESGYFDTDASRKPLLHLWSLGVEEQYYLIWPVILFFLRSRRRLILAALFAIAAVSFAISLYASYRHPTYAYYLPVTRFWELMIGSGLAFLTRYDWRGALRAERAPVDGATANLRSILGIAAIALSLAFVDEHKPFPGWWAVPVCVGAALVISAGPAAWLNRWLLGNRAMVYVGLISYPLYLWHWPLLAFGHVVSRDPPGAWRVAALLLAVGLAALTYHLIEQPLRRRRGRNGGTLPIAGGLLAVMVGIAAVSVAIWTAVLPPLSARDPRVARISAAVNDWETPAVRAYAGPAPGTTLFFGDSHMQQYWPRLEALIGAASPRRHTVDFRYSPGCAPVPGLERRSVGCLDFVTRAFQRAHDADVQTIVIAASWQGFSDRGDYYRADDRDRTPLDVLDPQNGWIYEQFTRELASLRTAGKRVVVLLSSPRGEALDPANMVDRQRLIPVALPPVTLSRGDVEAAIGPIDALIAAAARGAGVDVLQPLDWFCSASACPSVDEDGSPLYKDATHLRASTARSRAVALDSFVLANPETPPAK